MEIRLPPITPMFGDLTITALEELTGVEVDIILIAFPHGVDNPQPTFLTNFEAGIMESVIKQVAVQMTDKFVASRVVVKGDQCE
jgi:hypothetical protein